MVMVKITFLGTSDQIPSLRRNHFSALLNYNEENILVDCGEGTQRQIRRANLNPCKITRILITHWHGDHILGLPGLLSTLAVSGYNKKLFIYGPKGISKNIFDMLKLFNFHREYELEVKEVSGKFFDNGDFCLEAQEMKHGIPCNAYSFTKKGQLRIDKDKLKKSGLPEGPLLSKIKEGKDVSYEGKKYKAKDLTYKEEDLKISFVLDTVKNPKIVSFVKNSNLFVSESTFLNELEDQAKEHFHMTAGQVGEIAKKAEVKKLALVHLSQRYEADTSFILNEAKKAFGKEVLIPKDLDFIEID